MKMDKSMLTAYQNGWKAVADVEIQELRQSTISERWQQLNALLRMAAALNVLQQEDEIQIMTVRTRWHFLKEQYLAEQRRRIA